MMSQKDYRRIAEGTKNIYNRLRAIHELKSAAAVEVHARELAKYFKENNPRFDREKFLEACGFSGD